MERVERSGRAPLGRGQVVAAITALSTVAHLWRLDLRPLAHDEAIDAWFSWQARGWGVMRYDPVYHGPLRFYLEGPVLRFLGQGAFQARLVAAVAGIVATALIAGSTRTLGRVGAPVAALVFVLSPTVLTVTRTGREDSLVALVSLGLLLVVARVLTEPRPVHLVLGAVLLAASFGLKETTFLFGLATVAFLLPALGVAAARPDGDARRVVRSLARFPRQPWLWALSGFAVVFMVIYTSGLRYSAGLESGLFDGLRYWWGQHDVGRGGQPWFFHLLIYAAYEWFAVALAAVGLAVTVRRRSLVGAWFATMGLVQAALYSWAGEKFSWLAVHPLVPLVLLGGLGAQAIAEHATAPRRRVAFAGIGAIGLLLTGAIAVGPAITDGADPSELLVNVQTSDDVPPVVRRLARAQADGTVGTILVDSGGGAGWPWGWYLHDLDGVAFREVELGDVPTGYDALLLLAPTDIDPEVPAGYRLERFRLRVWWVPDYEGASLGDLARWFLTRETWSPTASLDQHLIIRDDA